MNINTVKTHFEFLGFECDDIQPDDFSVGIFDGWVVFRDRIKPNQPWLYISWSNAMWHSHNNNERAKILKDSVNCELV